MGRVERVIIRVVAYGAAAAVIAFYGYNLLDSAVLLKYRAISVAQQLQTELNTCKEARK